MEPMETSVVSSSSNLDGRPDRKMGRMDLGQRPNLDNQYHPLLNELILEQVFKHVRKTDLKECRGVNKQWCSLSIPFMRSNLKIIIHCGQRPYSKAKGYGYTHSVEDFVETFKSNKFGIPFGKYQLAPFSAKDNVFQEFLKLIGDTAKKIDLTVYHREDKMRSYAIEDISEVLRSTPSLEYFKIPTGIYSCSGDIQKLFPQNFPKPRLTHLRKLYNYDKFPQERRKLCPTFHEELFEAAPNLSEITIYDVIKDGMSTGVEILSVIEKLRRESSIEELSISEAGTAFLETLRKMISKLTLKTFFVRSLNSADPEVIVQLFPETLELIHVSNIIFTSFNQFRKLPHLRNLSLDISPHFKSKLDLNEIFPAMDTLFLWPSPDRSGALVYDEFISDSDSCPNMKSLYIYDAYLRIIPFNQITTIFPNLTNLELSIREDGMEILKRIWTHLTHLEDLDISGTIPTTITTESLDSVFTGIPINGILQIQKTVSALDRMTPELRGDTILNLRNQHRQFPSVGDLTNLSSLKIRVTATGTGTGEGEKDNVKVSGQRYLTDLTGYMAFYSMKHLQRLEVFQSKMTKTCCEILTTDLELLSGYFEDLETTLVHLD